jgi:hypothetical protein
MVPLRAPFLCATIFERGAWDVESWLQRRLKGWEPLAIARDDGKGGT